MCSPRLDLSNNKLEYLDNIAHMTRLKRLRADNNALYSAGLAQLSSLVLLSLAHNRVEMLCGMEYLHNLVNLNLSDNLISGTVSFLLRVPCRACFVRVCVSCGSDWPGVSHRRVLRVGQAESPAGAQPELQQHRTHLQQISPQVRLNRAINPIHGQTNDGLVLGRILRHLQSLPKLRYLYFNGNPVQQSIFKYRFFVISQLPKLHFLDGDPVTKEVCAPHTHTHTTRTNTTRPQCHCAGTQESQEVGRKAVAHRPGAVQAGRRAVRPQEG